MLNIRISYIKIAAAFALALTVAGGAIARNKTNTPAKATVSNIKIRNFGQMDDRFYRGAQPSESDFRDLAALGIKTVIDLQAAGQSYEKRDVEALGMQYINIPMEESTYPTDGQVAMFLKVVDDPKTGKFFVHCAGGKHRTGVMGAVYRFTHDHWNLDQVYSEMKQYNFSTSWGHGMYKDFVQDYWKHVQATPSASAVRTAAASTNK